MAAQAEIWSGNLLAGAREAVSMFNDSAPSAWALNVLSAVLLVN
jgi:hypothetical protein